MIAELNKWLREQEAALAEEGGAKHGSTMRAYSTGFGDAIRRLREWVASHVGAASTTEPAVIRCRCGGVAAGVVRTRPAASIELVSTVCRCGRPLTFRIEETRIPDGTGTCDGCGEVLEILAGVAIVHDAPEPPGVRKSRHRCPGAGRPPR